MDHEARTTHASQQGDRRTGEQDRSSRLEDPHQARGDLSLGRRLTKALPKFAAQRTDDTTVDRHGVNPLGKPVFFKTEPSYWERHARISSWPGRQKRPTRERPDTFTQTALWQKRTCACKNGADHTFPEAMSFNTRLSRLRFATRRFSFPFSCSSSFNRFAWSICNPPYSLRQRKYVCSTISASLHACAVVFPLATATSICRSRFTTCSG